MNRDAFFTRLRSAVQSAQRFAVHTRHDLPPVVGRCGPIADLPARLAAEIDAVGGRAHLVSDLSGARMVIAAILEEISARAAVCWEHDVLERLDLVGLLNARDVAPLGYETLCTLPPDAQRSAILAADIGITSCDMAIAETGSLVMLAGVGHERVASLLPPLHVAIVTAEQIVPDLFDVFAALKARGLDRLPSNITFITGPSKTGDLELQLTTGVHGPGRWEVVIVRG